MSKGHYAGRFGGSRQARPFGRAGATCKCGCEEGHPCGVGRELGERRDLAWIAKDGPGWKAAIADLTAHLGLPARAPVVGADEATAQINAAQLEQLRSATGP